MKTAFNILISLMILSSGSWAGQFEQFRLRLDGTIETPAVLSSVTSQPVPNAGQAITVQMFLPAGANQLTLGYDISFRMVGKDIAQYLSAPTGTTWDGSALTISQQVVKVSALLIGTPLIPSSGHLGTVSFTVLQNFSEGDVLAVSVATIGDVNSISDALDVTRASILFSTRIEAVGGDLDLDGDVDFSDFLGFAENFGHEGQTPTPPDPLLVTLIDTVNIVDTLSVIVRDTVMVAVHDTITVTQDPFDVVAITNPISAPSVLSDRLTLALDADMANNFQNANKTNGLEIQVLARAAADGYASFEFKFTFDPNVLSYRDFVPQPSSDSGVFSETNSGLIGKLDTAPNAFSIGGQRSTDRNSGIFGKLRFRRIAKGDAVIKLESATLFLNGGTRVNATLHNSEITLTYP